MCVHTAPDDGDFEGSLHDFSRFSTFRELASISFPDAGVVGDPGSKHGTCLFMDVDRDGEFFSVVAYNNKIKVTSTCTYLISLPACFLINAH